MSAYGRHFILGNFVQDVLPDYLTCGYCAREFLLDNITLFIAHKVGGCYKIPATRKPNLLHAEDESTSLTCSSCSRMFMTARGLLHHVQEDHQMNLCHNGCPGPVSDVKPPPAHSTVTGSEFIATEKRNNSTSSHTKTSSASSFDPIDEPTDLSMTYFSPPESILLRSINEQSVKSTKPSDTLSYSHICKTNFGLPKKRKFLHSENGDMTTRIIFSDDVSHATDNDNVKCCNDNLFHTEDNDNIAEDSCVFLRVKTESHVDEQPLMENTDRKEQEKHVKLRRLLQKITSTPEPEEHDVNTAHSASSPSIPASVRLSPHRASESFTDFENNQFSFLRTKTEIQDRSTEPFTANVLPRSTEEHTIDDMIRASLAQNFSTKEQNILLFHSSTSVNKTIPNLSTMSGFNSSHIMVPTEKTKQHCTVTFKTNRDKGDTIDNIENVQRRRKTLSEISKCPDSHAQSPTCSFIPEDAPREAADKIGTEHQDPEYEVQVKTSFHNHESSNIYQKVNYPGKENNELCLDKTYNLNQLVSESSFVVKRHEKLQTHDAHIENKEESISTCAQSTYCMPVSQTWMSLQDDDSVDITDIRNNPKSSPRLASQSLDISAHESLDIVCKDTEDILSHDMKVLKRRRYPTSRPFKCAHCEQAFNQRIHLKKHMSKHTGVKPFKCQQCDYSTVERSHLKVHYRIHTGEKPYRCLYCDYATAQNSTLKIHLKRHHEGQTTIELKRSNSHRLMSLENDEWTGYDSPAQTLLSERHRHPSESDNSSSIFSGKCLRSLSQEKESSLVHKDSEDSTISNMSFHQQEPQLCATSFKEHQFKLSSFAGEVSYGNDLNNKRGEQEHIDHGGTRAEGDFMTKTNRKDKTEIQNEESAKQVDENVTTNRQLRNRPTKPSRSLSSLRDRIHLITTQDLKLSPIPEFRAFKGDKIEPRNEVFTSSLNNLGQDSLQKHECTTSELANTTISEQFKQHNPQKNRLLSSALLGLPYRDKCQPIDSAECKTVKQIKNSEKLDKAKNKIAEFTPDQAEQSILKPSQSTRMVLVDQPRIHSEDCCVNRSSDVPLVSIPEKEFIRG